MVLLRQARALILPDLPGRNDYWAAWRLTLGVGIPAFLLLGWGHPNLIIYAVFGAFIGMYGRDDPPQLRLLHQSQAAVLLLSGTILGISLSYAALGPWGLICIESSFAALASIYADRYSLKPAGPFFSIFALGACASLTPAVPWTTAVGISLASAILSILIGLTGWVTRREWQRNITRKTASDPYRAKFIHAMRYLLAMAMAGSGGLLLGIGHPYWAMAAAAVPLAADTLTGRIRRGLHRMLGTLLGVVVTALILLPHPSAVVLVIVVILAQFPSELFMTRNYAFALMFFTPMILLMTLLASPVDIEKLIGDRVLETMIGAVAGMLVAVFIREPRRTNHVQVT